MALAKVLDFSQARPSATQIRAAGYLGVYRYVCSDISEEGRPGKRLTAIEKDTYLNADLDIGLHGEDDSQAAQGGAARGSAQATQWASYAHDVLGWPKGAAIVAAVDFNVAAVYGNSYPAVIDEYLHAVAEGLAPAGYFLGVYGDHGVLQGAHAAGRGHIYVMTDAWDINTPQAFVHLHQRSDYADPRFPNTDYNDVLIEPLGTYRQLLGDPMTAPSQWNGTDDAHVKTVVLSALNEGMGVGQLSWAATNQQAYARLGDLINDANSLSAAMTDVKSHVVNAEALLNALPADATPTQIAQALVPLLPSADAQAVIVALGAAITKGSAP